MELVKKMLLQEVRPSDTKTDGDGNMLINNGCGSQPDLDDFHNESAATRMKTSSYTNVDIQVCKKGLEEVREPRR